jgi:putative ABC transport system permease protein
MHADLKQAARALRRAPGFTLTTVLTIGLGVGAATAMFAVLNGVVLRPLPYPGADRLLRIWSAQPARDLPFFSVSAPDALDWDAQAGSLAAFGAFERPESLAWTDAVPAQELLVSRATPGIFEVLGVTPLLGRPFDERDGPDVVVLGHEMWQRRYGGDPGVVGRRLTLDGGVVTIVAVMPERFAVPGTTAEAWRPLALEAGTDRSRRYLRVLARMRSGVTLEAATTELATVASRLVQAHPASNTGWTVTVRPLSEAVVGPRVRQALALLLAVVALVLVIACANVAHLVLVRSAARERELAIRASLGASRRRLMAPLVAECALIAAAGGVLGVLLARWAIGLLRAAGPAEVPRLADVRLDPATAAFAVAAASLAALLFGLPPAWHAARAAAVSRALKEGRVTAGSEPARLRSAIVAIEVALAVVVAAGSLLLVRSYVRLQSVSPGFDAAGVTIVPLAVPERSYASAPAVRAFYDAVLERAAALPGVSAVSLVSRAPFSGPNSANLVVTEGQPTDRSSASDVDYRVIAPGYFRVMGIPLRRGRDLRAGDGADVAIVSEEMARRLWPGQDAVGRRFRLGDLEAGPWITVVGISGDALYRDLEASERRPLAYVPHAFRSDRAMTLVMRAAAGSPPTAAMLRDAVARIDRDVPVPAVRRLDEVVSGELAERRFQATLCASFASLGALLAVIGVYGVMAHFVVRRRPEIAVRMALGATPRSIVGFVARRGGAAAVAGLGAGIAGALALRPVLASQLYGISPTDAPTLAAAAGGIAAAAALAGWAPARRAIRLDPVRILREG